MPISPRTLRKMTPRPVTLRHRTRITLGECPICQEPIETTPGLVMPCKHKFHKDCIKEWRMISHTCPVCRGPIQRIVTGPRYRPLTAREHAHNRLRAYRVPPISPRRMRRMMSLEEMREETRRDFPPVPGETVWDLLGSSDEES
jgi:hypothetical protein